MGIGDWGLGNVDYTQSPKKNINTFDDENTSLDSLSEESSTKEETMNSFNDLTNNPEEKLFLLMIKRRYYINKMEKIERYLDSLNNLNKNISIEKEQRKLSLCFNKLSNFESLYITLEDYHKGLNLQKRIISILKRYIINAIG